MFGSASWCCSSCRGSIAARSSRSAIAALGYKIALGLFALSFVMLGAVGAGVTAENDSGVVRRDADVTYDRERCSAASD